MIQQKLKLSTEISLLLKSCDEIWVAVAMISDNGFKFIQDRIDENSTQNYIVGVGLPTSPLVLRKLMELDNGRNFHGNLFHKEKEFFHPKVYIFRTNDKLTAFVGSGNCTDGGFDKNWEMTVKTDDQEFCKGLLTWFNATQRKSMKITEEFLESYEVLYKRRKQRMKEEKEEMKILSPDEKLSFDDVDFTNQFFKKEHFQAFEGGKPYDPSDAINEERLRVRNKLYELNTLVSPQIKSRNWDLSEHYVFDDIVSSYRHSHYTPADIGAIWLHYGRDKNTIKEYGADQTPLDYMRLQVIIHKESVGIWNRIGKDNGGSRIDREHLKDQLKRDPVYRQKLFSIIQNLPPEFFIELNGQKRFVPEFENETKLTEFLLCDNYKSYFIIGIELTPGNDQLSNVNIVNTVLKNFELLYPTYQIIKHNLFLN